MLQAQKFKRSLFALLTLALAFSFLCCAKEQPLYHLQDPGGLDPAVRKVIEDAVADLNQRAGLILFSFESGSTPVELIVGDLSGDRWGSTEWSRNFAKTILAPKTVSSPTALYGVFQHEMGHVVGLPHSEDYRDIMYPIFLLDHHMSEQARNELVRRMLITPKVR